MTKPTPRIEYALGKKICFTELRVKDVKIAKTTILESFSE